MKESKEGVYGRTWRVERKKEGNDGIILQSQEQKKNKKILNHSICKTKAKPPGTVPQSRCAVWREHLVSAYAPGFRRELPNLYPSGGSRPFRPEEGGGRAP